MFRADGAINKLELMIITDEKVQMSSYEWLRSSFNWNSCVSWYRMRIKVFKFYSDFRFRLEGTFVKALEFPMSTSIRDSRVSCSFMSSEKKKTRILSRALDESSVNY